MSRSSTKRQRSYNIKKTSIKDEFIDRQILVLHGAMAEKILAHPELVQQVQDRLEEKRENGSMGYGAYITWTSILEHINEPEAFKQAMQEDSKKMRRLRRITPFVGILNEEERQAAITKDSAGVFNPNNLML